MMAVLLPLRWAAAVVPMVLLVFFVGLVYLIGVIRPTSERTLAVKAAAEPFVKIARAIAGTPPARH